MYIDDANASHSPLPEKEKNPAAEKNLNNGPKWTETEHGLLCYDILGRIEDAALQSEAVFF